MALNNFLSNQGTQTALLTDNTGGSAGTLIAVQKVDISPIGTAGTIWNGNVGLNAGVNSIGNIGTIGTLGLGTVRQDGRPTQNIVTYGTQISGTAAAVATVVGSAAVGAGTSLWLQSAVIDNPNGNVLCVLGFGTAQQGTNVFFRGQLGTSGAPGVVLPLPKPSNAGMTNQDLVFSLGAAGTIDLSISYFISD